MGGRMSVRPGQIADILVATGQQLPVLGDDLQAGVDLLDVLAEGLQAVPIDLAVPRPQPAGQGPQPQAGGGGRAAPKGVGPGGVSARGPIRRGAYFMLGPGVRNMEEARGPARSTWARGPRKQILGPGGLVLFSCTCVCIYTCICLHVYT